jgi:hypothetical protein
MIQLTKITYHFMIALPHVKPLPAAKTTVSPVLIFPFSQASVKAIGIEAQSLPYFFEYYYHQSTLNFFCEGRTKNAQRHRQLLCHGSK